MRYYVTINGGGDLSWLAEGAGTLVAEAAAANVRSLRILSGMDYQAFGVRGELLSARGAMTIRDVERRIRAGDDERGRGIVDQVRLIVSQAPIDDGPPQGGFGLLIGIHEGDAFGWRPGTGNYAGVVTVDRHARASKVAAVVQDLFQDVMLGNCASVQAVMRRHVHANGSMSAFYQAKARHARGVVAKGGAAGLFTRFDPDRYASFSSMARRDELTAMDKRELGTLATLWRDFMVDELGDHFLDPAAAADLVRTGYFHSARPERVAGGGQRPTARRRREDLPRDELLTVLGDRQVVTRTDRYVLCVRDDDRDIDATGPLFGWRNEKARSAHRLRLCTERTYRADMIEHVRRGIVTPIQLFLKAQ